MLIARQHSARPDRVHRAGRLQGTSRATDGQASAHPRAHIAVHPAPATAAHPAPATAAHIAAHPAPALAAHLAPAAQVTAITRQMVMEMGVMGDCC